MTHRVLDLESSEGFSKLLVSSPLQQVIQKSFKIPATVDFMKSFQDHQESLGILFKTLLTSFKEKSGTSKIFYEETDDGDLTRAIPFYGKSLMTHDQWFEFLKENLSYLCPHLTLREDTYQVIVSDDDVLVSYATVKCSWKAHPEEGVLLRNELLYGCTNVRAYFSRGPLEILIPSRSFSKSSTRYNRYAETYEECLKLMLLTLDASDVEDLHSLVYVIAHSPNLQKKISSEELYGLESSRPPRALILSDVFKELFFGKDLSNPHLDDLYYRATKFDATLEEFLSLNELGQEVLSYEFSDSLGRLLSSPLIIDRIFKE